MSLPETLGNLGISCFSEVSQGVEKRAGAMKWVRNFFNKYVSKIIDIHACSLTEQGV